MYIYISISISIIAGRLGGQQGVGSSAYYVHPPPSLRMMTQRQYADGPATRDATAALRRAPQTARCTRARGLVS